jgi:hypothetical protein
MNLRGRLDKLESAKGSKRRLQDLTDAELEARIASLVGLQPGELVTDEMLEKIIREAGDGGTTEEGRRWQRLNQGLNC